MSAAPRPTLRSSEGPARLPRKSPMTDPHNELAKALAGQYVLERELGVRYLLTGTVRWAKSPDGASRVKVSPELVEVGGGTARSRWQQPFDAPLTDVFQVQGDIAGKVASALDVALGDLNSMASMTYTYLAVGDLAGTQRVLEDTPPTLDLRVLSAQTAMYQDCYWIFTRAQQDTVLTLPDANFDGDPGSRAIAVAEIHYLRGDSALARSWGDSAQRLFRANPSDPQYQGLVGLGLAYAGRYQDAVQAGRKAVSAAQGTSIDETTRYVQNLLARTYVLAGQSNEALDLLEQLHDKTNFTTSGRLRIDPEWAPLQGNPRFEKLTGGRQ